MYRLFAQPFVQVQIKENIKASRNGPYIEGKPPVTGGFPSQGASYAENVKTTSLRSFDVIMTVLLRHLSFGQFHE